MSSHAHQNEYGAQGHGDHGHVIVSSATLRLVLIALLGFTALTVFASRGEMWLAHTLNVQIPQLVNVFVALSIAVVKTILVVSFFMQLRYDNPLNTMILIFTVVTVAFFLGFTSIDLGNRQTLEPYKGVYISPGGTGLAGAGPITRTARSDAIAGGAGNVKDLHGDHAAHPSSITDAGYSEPKPAAGSTSEYSRPVKRGGDGHGGGH